MSPAGRRRDDEAFVFNVVWTGTVFPYLRLFTESLIDHSGARFRYVANGCPPDQIALMEEAASSSAGRVVEVFVASPDAMLRHGDALDIVRAQRDDGPYFCLMDPDILARAPFLDPFHALLDDHDVVTSGTEVWSDDNRIPEGHPGVAGEHFYDRDGFVFGSPHMAIYRAGPLFETTARWDVGFGTGGAPVMRPDTVARIASFGREFLLYDTGKVVNILLQADGASLVHTEHPDLVHIGGLAHFLAPTGWVASGDAAGEPDWAEWRGMEARYGVARYAASVLSETLAGRPAPPIPGDAPPALAPRLALVRQELTTLVDRYGAPGGGRSRGAPATRG